MDDPSDFLDLFDVLADMLDAGSLDQGGVDALATLLEGADYTSFGTEMVHTVSELDPSNIAFWGDPTGELFANFDPSEWGEFAADSGEFWTEGAPLASGDFIETGADLSDFGLWGADLDPLVVQEQIQSAFDSVPPAFTQGLNIEDINWDSALDPENPGYHGSYEPQLSPDGKIGGRIELFDHTQEVVPTLHHEIGHHIATLHPDFVSETVFALGGENGFLSELSNSLNLGEYESWQVPQEAFAEAINYFMTQPELLQELAPNAFAVINNWWTAAATA